MHNANLVEKNKINNVAAIVTTNDHLGGSQDNNVTNNYSWGFRILKPKNTKCLHKFDLFTEECTQEETIIIYSILSTQVTAGILYKVQSRGFLLLDIPHAKKKWW